MPGEPICPVSVGAVGSDTSTTVTPVVLAQFKVINDSCGHVAGDELLRQLGNCLLEKVRKVDTLARLGGDEFGVLLQHCSVEDATAVARELLRDR